MTAIQLDMFKTVAESEKDSLMRQINLRPYNEERADRAIDRLVKIQNKKRYYEEKNI